MAVSLTSNSTTLAAFRDRHAGETIIVCGCGASLSTFEDAADFVTIGVNDVGRMFDPTYLVVLNGRSQFKGDRFRYIQESRANSVFTQLDLRLEHPSVVRFQLGQRGGTDWSNGASLPFTQNSPYVAVCLAAFMGAKRIGMIGVDFTDHHFFAQTGRHTLSSRLSAIDAEYRALAEALRTQGVELVNLSASSRLTALPKVDPEDLVPAREPERMPAALAPGRAPRVFGVHYKFLSCGDVFRDGLRHAAAELGVQWEDACWDTRGLPERVARHDPDLLLVVHGRRFAGRWRGRFERYNSAVWLVDEPYEVDDTASWSGLFRHVLVNDPSSLQRHRNAHYLPVAFDPSVHFEASGTRDYDVGFVGGGNPSRERALLRLAEAGLLSYVVGGPWRDRRLSALSLGRNLPHLAVADLYRRTRVVVNVFRDRHHFNRDGVPAVSLNPRVYEALACGAAVVSEFRPELRELFPAVPSFEGTDGLVSLVAELVGDERMRRACVDASRSALDHHSYARRLRRVLELAVTSAEPQEPIVSRRTTWTRARPNRRTVLPGSDGDWLDCGGVTESSDGSEFVLRATRHAAPGSERGIASELPFEGVRLGFELYLNSDTVFLAKVHQQSPMNQLTNSYHLHAAPDRSYLAMHGRVLAPLEFARNKWLTITLERFGSTVAVTVDGERVAQVADSQLERGFCFLGVKSGTARLRKVRLDADREEVKRGSSSAGDERFEVVVPATDAARPRVSIVTTVYDRVECLRECLRNTRELSFPDFEQIVVADCPAPDVARRIESICREEGGARTSEASRQRLGNRPGVGRVGAGARRVRRVLVGRQRIRSFALRASDRSPRPRIAVGFRLQLVSL